MHPEEWKARWAEGETGDVAFVTFPADIVAAAELTDVDRLLLVEHGLPEDAAPYLSFATKPGLLGTLRSIDQAPDGTEQFVEIGANGSGDPICLDGNSGAVCYLNHDDSFTPVMVNTSVSALLQFLELFRDLVRRSIAENGSDAYLDGNPSGAALESTVAAMRSIDSSALDAGTMWHEELRRG